MEAGGKRPDPPKLAQAAVRAAVAEAARLLPRVPLIAAVKILRRRMTRRPGRAPLPGVRGLAFLGFPLHAAAGHRATAATISSTCAFRCSSCRDTRRARRPCRAQTLCAALAPLRTLKLFQERGPFLSRSGTQRPHRFRDPQRLLDAFASWTAALT